MSRETVHRQTLVVIGNGMVGHALCKKLVEHGAAESFRIIVFGDEPRPAYDRVHLSDCFSGQQSNSLELSPRAWYRRHGIALCVNEMVTKVDRKRRLVRTSSGVEIEYDKLVLATGSKPFVPPIAGTEHEGVFVYRTVEDLEKIRDYSQRTSSGAVIGGGLLGLEAAKALLDFGLETHVIEVAPGLMPRQLDADCGAVLQKEIESLGVHVHLVKRTSAIEKDTNEFVLRFSRGAALPVGMVVISAGIRPRDELAADCGLELGERGGVAVNDRLETSDPRIYAIGECACHAGTIYGLVAPGYQMADVLAENLTGSDAAFQGGDQSARLKLLGVDVATLGNPLGETPNATTVTARGDDFFRRLILRRGRVVGAMSVGPWDEVDRVRQAIAAGQRMRSWHLGRFERTGHLWPAGSSLQVGDWPEAAVVCSCLQVSRGTLSKACREGADSAAMLAQQTGASTVCGSCKPLLSELAGGLAEKVPTNSRGLLAASIAAALVAFVGLFVPLPFATSVESTWHAVDFLWRDSLAKQVSGYTLVGVSLIGLLLSIRKRISWFTLGAFANWRLIHSVVGLLTLLGLAAHTGFHLGGNLNFALATTFLALNVVGAATGAIVAWESRATGSTAMLLRKWRPRVTMLHIWLLWPVPVLLAFHIASVYYY